MHRILLITVTVFAPAVRLAATTFVTTATTTNHYYSHDQPLLLVLAVTTCEHSTDVITTSAVVVSADAVALVFRVLLHAPTSYVLFARSVSNHETVKLSRGRAEGVRGSR